MLNVEDTSVKGYCLGPASGLDDNPANERELNAAGFHLERFFIHACLYFACDRNEKVAKRTQFINSFLLY